MESLESHSNKNVDDKSEDKSYQSHSSYCEVLQKNKLQFSSVAGGMLLLLVSGLQIGWGTWRMYFQESIFITDVGLINFILMSWYVSAFFGGVIGAALVTNLRKNSIFYIAGSILIVSNIIIIVLYNEQEAIIFARCLAGFAHGLTYNATITHAAENVVKEMRGMLLSILNCIIFCGIFVSTLTALVNYGNNSTLSSDRLFGILGLVFSVLGITCTFFLTYETIPFLLRRSGSNDSEAVANMLKLRNESVMTSDLTNDLDEMKLMVAQNKQNNILADGNGSAVGKMIILRMLSSLTNNFLLNTIFIVLTAQILTYSSFHMSAIILSGVRFGSSFIPIISTDLIKRKIHLTVSGVISGILMLILAIIITSSSDFTQNIYCALGALCLAFQFFVSLGIDPMQHILLSEAFSTSKKAWSIAIVTTAEYMLQILFIGVFFASSARSLDRISLIVLLFVTAGLMFAFVFLIHLAIPETFKKSLKETRDLFCR